MKNNVNIGKKYSFACRRCNGTLDRKGIVCCSCLLYTNILTVEKTKAELRAITKTMKYESPTLLKRLRDEARATACRNISIEYGIKLL